jgi:hypothetical protein
MIYIFLVVVGFTAFYLCLANPNKGLEDLCPANRLTRQSGHSLSFFIGLVFVVCVIKTMVEVPDISKTTHETESKQNLEVSRTIIDTDSMQRRLNKSLVWTTKARQ